MNGIFEFFMNFVRELMQKDDSSQVAAGRLKGALCLDRLSLSPAILDSIRNDVVKTISRYLVIDEAAMTLAVNSQGRTVALAASIPVLRPREGAPIGLTVHPTIHLGRGDYEEVDVSRAASPLPTEPVTITSSHCSEGSEPAVRIIVQDRSRVRNMRRRRSSRRVPGDRSAQAP